MIISAVEGPLGIEDGSITNNQITASSYWQGENVYPGWKGRLNNADGCWSEADGDSTPWIQVAFTSDVIITAIQTQGAESNNFETWAKELQIQTGYSEANLSYIMHGANPKVRILR